jgi:hypothetical protein
VPSECACSISALCPGTVTLNVCTIVPKLVIFSAFVHTFVTCRMFKSILTDVSCFASIKFEKHSLLLFSVVPLPRIY